MEGEEGRGGCGGGEEGMVKREEDGVVEVVSFTGTLLQMAGRSGAGNETMVEGRRVW